VYGSGFPLVNQLSNNNIKKKISNIIWEMFLQKELKA
jgi:hypothetical protein